MGTGVALEVAVEEVLDELAATAGALVEDVDVGTGTLVTTDVMLDVVEVATAVEDWPLHER